jgi:hypothetical protein
MTRNWPDEISVGLPSIIQLFKGSATFVVAKAVNTAPGVLVKVNRKDPFPSLVGSVRIIVVAGGGVMSRTSETLGMPLTKTVA